MENSPYTDASIKMYLEAMIHYQNVGPVIQAYLHRSPDDISRLNGEKLNVRICKGIYKESETIALKNKSDINEVIKAVEEKFLQSEQVSIYVEVDTFGGITLDALIADLKFALPNFKRFSKKAVITEKKWIERWIEIADPLFPSIQVRHFTHEQKAEAIAWLKT